MKPGEWVADRYQIVEELGAGGMGAVYVAVDSRFDAHVALKVASAAGAAYDEFKQRFMREARIGNMLGQRAGFVRAFDWGVLGDGRTLYLAMDLVENAQELDLLGGSLEERLLRLREAARLVAEAHGAGVIHRDLKPGNFFMAGDGSIWLGDFGLAKHVDDSTDSVCNAMLTQSGMAMGTPYFMPPEQFENVRDVGTGGDVYALGAMLFYLLTGRYPYEGTNPGQILSSQMKVRYGKRPQPRPRQFDGDVLPELDRLCAEATAISPELRTPSAKAFIDGLDRILERGLPSVANQQTVAVPKPVRGEGAPARRRQSGRASAPRPVLAASGEPPPQAAVSRHQGKLPVLLAAGTFLILGGVFALTRPAVEEAEPVPSPELSKAQRWEELEKRVAAGDVDSMVELGILYEKEGDPVEAVSLYERAAQKGSPRAMVKLGRMHLDGRGVDASEELAERWFEEAADKGDEEGKKALAALSDRVKARELAREAEQRRALERQSREQTIEDATKYGPGPAPSFARTGRYRDGNALRCRQCKTQASRYATKCRKCEAYFDDRICRRCRRSFSKETSRCPHCSPAAAARRPASGSSSVSAPARCPGWCRGTRSGCPTPSLCRARGSPSTSSTDPSQEKCGPYCRGTSSSCKTPIECHQRANEERQQCRGTSSTCPTRRTCHVRSNEKYAWCDGETNGCPTPTICRRHAATRIRCSVYCNGKSPACKTPTACRLRYMRHKQKGTVTIKGGSGHDGGVIEGDRPRRR